MSRRLGVHFSLLGVVLGALVGCAHRAAVPDTGQGRVYDVGEPTLKPIVARWFANRGIELRQSEDPHVLVSKVRERNSGVVGGSQTPPPEANSTPLETLNPGDLARALEQERTAQLEEKLRDAAREFRAEIDEAPYRAEEGKTGGGPKRLGSTTTRQSVWGKDRVLNKEREQWMVQFLPVTPSRTLLRIFKSTANTWDSSADQSYNIGVGSISKTTSGQQAMVTGRDSRTEEALAEHLDFAAAVEILGEARVKQLLPAEVVDPAPAAAPEPESDDQSECHLDVGSLALSPGGVVLLSDLSGTAETAGALRGAVCGALRRGLKVTVGLSMDANEQDRLNRFMASPGAPDDRAALLDGPFWRRVYQDGRSSAAMVEALEAFRSFRASGRSLAVLALDVDVPGNARTAFMSARVLEHLRSHPDRVVIGLLSNTQASLKPGAQWDPAYLPLGYRLLAAGVPLKSFDVGFLEGTQWTCRLSTVGLIRCGEGHIRPGPKQLDATATPDTRAHVKTFEFRSKEGFDGLLFVGRAHASGPALAETR